MSIAVDAMGGDHAPSEIVKGTLEAAAQIKTEIILVGDIEKIKPFLPERLPTNVMLHHAEEVVGMHEKPTDAHRLKKNSSIRVAVNLVKEGKAQAFVSAGNTGACVTTCLLEWRQMKGLHRPAIASIMPSVESNYLLLDSGASPDVDPEHLVEFALMGRAYMERVMGRKDPKVQLLNIGEEEGKGNAFAKQAYKLLSAHAWFHGNIEGKDMFLTGADVVVCDAFVGNIALKASEGVAEMIFRMIKKQIPSNPIAKLQYAPLRRIMKPIAAKADWAEIGGSPLLGLNGIAIIAHGRSDTRAVKNAILMANRSIEGELMQNLSESVEREFGSKK